MAGTINPLSERQWNESGSVGARPTRGDTFPFVQSAPLLPRQEKTCLWTWEGFEWRARDFRIRGDWPRTLPLPIQAMATTVLNVASDRIEQYYNGAPAEAGPRGKCLMKTIMRNLT